MRPPKARVFSRDWGDVLWRLAVSPALALLIVVVCGELPRRPLTSWPMALVQGVVGSLMAGAVSASPAMIIGLPLYFLLRWLNWSWPIAFVLGAAAIPVSILLAVGLRSGTDLQAAYPAAMVLAAWGGLAGFIFWMLLRKRPKAAGAIVN